MDKREMKRFGVVLMDYAEADRFPDDLLFEGKAFECEVLYNPEPDEDGDRYVVFSLSFEGETTHFIATYFEGELAEVRVVSEEVAREFGPRDKRCRRLRKILG